jgi:hypothetical protein
MIEIHWSLLIPAFAAGWFVRAFVAWLTTPKIPTVYLRVDKDGTAYTDNLRLRSDADSTGDRRLAR